MKIIKWIHRLNSRRIASLLTVNLMIKKPLFILRVLQRIVYEKSTGKCRFWSVLFATHYKCVLNCAHCYEKSFFRTNKSSLTTDEKIKILKNCLKEGILTFDFIGGESFLDKEFPKLIKSCSPHKSHIAVSTNGFLLDEEKIKAYQRLGVDKLNISLDSWFRVEHDKNRGVEGAYEKAMATIDICQKCNMNLSINFVVYNGTTKTESFRRIVDFAVKRKIKLTFLAAVPLGRCENKKEIIISEEDKDNMQQWHEKYPFLSRNCVQKCPICPAFSKLFAISAYGDVMPCDFIHISFGNLKNESLHLILKRVNEFDKIKGKGIGCIPAEDIDFINRYLPHICAADPYPITVQALLEKKGSDVNDN
ncbi:radical SAM protein [Desulfobacula phenolica]|uniref:Radical SAM superfamily enzyme, MoaA/NifB/PqqE/SkfB family n=1 Tax=Desulfobacula phenolica TaxID=90732 RepID=A0A1H2DSZ2_9BACT|nr:radical SAM protein [Desulfobacula phenolica]SDT85548.1 Radical SAM superfamily enzyme, MoaA/NifB/PqqE/SkfB family [Desulfobacula phenolica]